MKKLKKIINMGKQVPQEPVKKKTFVFVKTGKGSGGLALIKYGSGKKVQMN